MISIDMQKRMSYLNHPHAIQKELHQVNLLLVDLLIVNLLIY